MRTEVKETNDENHMPWISNIAKQIFIAPTKLRVKPPSQNCLSSLSTLSNLKIPTWATDIAIGVNLRAVFNCVFPTQFAFQIDYVL